jgi:epoxyqueuosine reductase
MSHKPPPRQQLAEQAAQLGFDAFGVSSVAADLRREYYLKWITQGKHAGMSWLARHLDRRLDPRHVLTQARSILCLGMSYHQSPPDRDYRIAQYALGKDYHKVMLKRMKQLCTWMRTEFGSDQKPYVDTGPVLEKPIAAQAGLGWQGKSTILLSQDAGTWLFLGEIFTTLEVPPDKPAKDRCGSCTRCLQACPTQAITAPYQLDARLCLSYWNIEHKGSIPEDMRTAMGERLFGCDDCLDVCPWNRFAKQTREARFAARPLPPLRQLLNWDEPTFMEKMAGTPIRRLGHERWLRNGCIVLGNTGSRADLPQLEDLRANSGSALVAEHAQWAQQQIIRRSGPRAPAGPA